MSSFIAILTCRSYRSKNPNLRPLVLLCSALITEVTALVYSLWPKDLYGTIMPTCYIRMIGIIWSFGKTHFLTNMCSYLLANVKRAFVIDFYRSIKRGEKRSSTDCTIFRKVFTKCSWRVGYVTKIEFSMEHQHDILLVTCIISLENMQCYVIWFYHYRHSRVICWIVLHMSC